MTYIFQRELVFTKTRTCTRIDNPLSLIEDADTDRASGDSVRVLARVLLA